MIIYNDGTWECGADEDDAPKNAVILPDDSAVAQQIRRYDRVQLIGLTDNNYDDIQVTPLEDRHSVILAELDRLDLQAVRPLRAIAAGTATETDRQKLTEIEEQVAQLRKELANITDAE